MLQQVEADLRRAGREPQVRADDALIAAVAPTDDVPLHTANPDDFAGFDDLRVVPVPVPPRT